MLKLKRQPKVKFEKINIREFFNESKKLMVFLPEDKLESFKVVESLQNWYEDFAEIIFFAPAWQVNFLRKLKQVKLVNVSDVKIANCKHKDAVIFYFYDELKMNTYLADCPKALILAPSGSQLEFSPQCSSSIEYIQQVASIMGLKGKTVKLFLTDLCNSKDALRKEIIQNKFPNFGLHITNGKDRAIKNLTLFLKNNFSANIHFTANSCKMKDIPNIKTLENVDLLKLCALVESIDMLLTDDLSLHKLLKELNLKSIFIDEIKELTSLKTRITSRLKGLS